MEMTFHGIFIVTTSMNHPTAVKDDCLVFYFMFLMPCNLDVRTHLCSADPLGVFYFVFIHFISPRTPLLPNLAFQNRSSLLKDSISLRFLPHILRRYQPRQQNIHTKSRNRCCFLGHILPSRQIRKFPLQFGKDSQGLLVQAPVVDSYFR